MTLRALIFDVDGTLADTEETHRLSYHEAFREHGLDWRWEPDYYTQLLRVAGGKERIVRHIESLALPEAERHRLLGRVGDLHATEMRHYAARVEQGAVPLCPGIGRLLQEARSAGVAMAVATATSPANVERLIRATTGKGAEHFFSVMACGDAVTRKKPAPDVYNLALERLKLPAEDCIAFEDSEIGVQSARAAGICTIAVATRWTRSHDLSAASLVLPTLGDPEAPLDAASRERLGGDGWVGIETLEKLLARTSGRTHATRGESCSPTAPR
jgi:HAD superfamily hydrolase (TIGR01509 family)